MILSVWAPRARTVELVTEADRLAMRAQADGYWQIEIEPARAASGYRFSIDGGKALPDPRSRWQPDGVHGASRLIDPATLRPARQPDFRPAPLREAVLYELHVGTFSPEGTYAGVERHLSHLVDLGITHIELMPLATFPGRHGWGYDGAYLYAPHPAYGTPAELAHLIAACHERGLGVLIDVVYNHLGPDGNYLGAYGPYFTDRIKTPWGEAVNYDGARSEEVRRFVIDNAKMWLRDYGFDGLRLDAVHAIFSFEAVHILEQLALEVHELGAELGRSWVLIAESDLNDPRLVLPPARGGYDLDAHWADDFHHALHRYFTGDTAGYYSDFNGLDDLAIALRDSYVYQGRMSGFRERRHGRPPDGVRPDQLVVCSQNHDQIGNRAGGERLSMLVGLPQQKAIAALTLLSPFVPLLFQGEEWGAQTPFLYFTDHQDAELGRLVVQGRAAEFAHFHAEQDVPNPQAPETYERSKLDWSEPARPEHAALLDWYRRLIRLRRSRSPAPGERARVAHDAKAGWLTLEYGGILAAFNFANHPQHVPRPAGRWELVLRAELESQGSAPTDVSTTMAAASTHIFKR